MNKKRTFLSGIVVLLLTFTSLFATSEAEASYSDNTSKVYYHLAKQVYNANGLSGAKNSGIQTALNQNLGSGKYKLLDTINVNKYSHKAATRTSGGIEPFKPTGFKAMAVVSESNKRLYIAVAGTQDMSDKHTARNVFEGDTPGQLYHAQLYLNYIYATYPQYKDYKWYFTGHSLGGFVVSKLYLDIRASRWHNASNFYKYGRAVKKANISGVYTFNTLPVTKNQVSTTQWDANKKGTYNSAMKNLYIENEWLNGIQDMHPTNLAYFGTKQAINKNVKHYKDMGYSPVKTGTTASKMTYDTASYYMKTRYTPVVQNHGISALASSVK